jgi:hypothetical protein
MNNPQSMLYLPGLGREKEKRRIQNFTELETLAEAAYRYLPFRGTRNLHKIAIAIL